jgi:serine/threonine-protein kinase
MQIGTPAYMAPEQAAGDPDVDFRADLYAFGVMAYELLAGQHPFAERRTAHAMVVAHMTEEPRALATHTTHAGSFVTNIVMRCLGKDPADRPESASAIVAALEGTPIPPEAPAAGAKTPAAIAAIAVLPFANMSGDPDNEYFSDGITDDLIAALTPLKGLKVAARTSSFAFKNKNVDLSTVGTTLGVLNVLQGSVRRAGNRVRVTVQLMNVAEETQLWSERYDRDLDDIFAIQDEIVRGIVEQLKLRLGLDHDPAPLVAPQTDDLEAYQLYLRGREAAHLRSPASLRRAIDYFRQALARDPNYARAHIGLAEAHIGLGVYQYIPTIEANEGAIRALNAAERLGGGELAIFHVLWGQLKLYLRADWHEAGPHFDRALGIDPNEPLAHAYLAFLNGMLGNLEVSKAAAARAQALDPLSVFVRAVSVMGFPAAGIAGADSAAALDAHHAALVIDPNSVVNLWMASVRLADFDRYAESLAYMQRAVELTQRGPLMVGLCARALALADRRAEALALRDELRDRAKRAYVGPAAFLMMIGLDLDDEAATAALIEANVEAMTGPTAIVTTVMRDVEPLLDHPRLGPLVRRLTLWATRPHTRKP